MPQTQFYNFIRDIPSALLRKARSIVRPAEPVILNIPLELLLHIVSYLPLQDYVCLALTCKTLNRKLRSVFSASELGFPRMRSKESPCSPQIMLLTQLEDDHWACCGGCQKLHPHKEITRQWMHVPPKQRRCTKWCGIADLCPCIALTPRDRSHLVNYLSEPAGRQPFSRKDFWEIQWANAVMKDFYMNAMATPQYRWWLRSLLILQMMVDWSVVLDMKCHPLDLLRAWSLCTFAVIEGYLNIWKMYCIHALLAIVWDAVHMWSIRQTLVLPSGLLPRSFVT